MVVSHACIYVNQFAYALKTSMDSIFHMALVPFLLQFHRQLMQI